jgi:hypothetical protein
MGTQDRGCLGERSGCPVRRSSSPAAGVARADNFADEGKGTSLTILLMLFLVLYAVLVTWDGVAGP